MLEIFIPHDPNQPLKYIARNEKELKSILRLPAIWRASRIEITAPEKNSVFPDYAPAQILPVLLANKHLLGGCIPHNLLNSDQRKILNKHIRKNKAIKNTDYFRLRRWGTIGAAVTATIAILSGQAFLWVIGATAIGGLTAYPLRKIHDKWTKRKYQHATTIRACPSKTEKEALKLGIKAGASWKGYFRSFTGTYRHPDVFRTAMRHAEEGNSRLVNEICKLK